jgi:hypothetical protein
MDVRPQAGSEITSTWRKKMLRGLFAATVVILYSVAAASAQQPVGPVAPKAPTTIETLDKGLSSAMKGDSVGTLWEKSPPAVRADYLQKAQDVIKGIGVGPVPPNPGIGPKPGPVPTPTDPKPAPNPGPVNPPTPTPSPTPPPAPTKREFELAFKNLQDAIARASKSDPRRTLSPEMANEIQSLLDGLGPTKR